MEQHPLPQNITGFQFKLIGDMTIRQFIYLASGVLGGYLISLLPWSVIFKWPLAISLATLGFAFAFMPFEERSLDRWLIAFIKAIYSPTQFLWKKSPPSLDFFAFARSPLSPLSPKEEPKKTKADLKEYLKTLPSVSKTSLDEQEELFLQKLDFTIGKVVIPEVPPPPPEPEEKLPEEVYPPQQPALPKVRIHKLKPPEVCGEIIFPLGERKIKRTEIELPKVPLSQIAKPLPKPPPTTTFTPLPPREVPKIEELPPKFLREQGKKEKKAPQVEKETKEELERLRLQNEVLTNQLKKFQEEIAALQKFAVQTTEGKIRLKEMLSKYEEAQKQKEKALNELTLLKRKVEELPKQVVIPTTAVPQASPRAQFIPASLAKSRGLPTLTQTPNVISGIVTDRQGRILPGVIITIRDMSENPVRALKTNQVGQFKIGTPLSNGSYTIELEKEGLEFDIIAIEVKGQILPPLEIKAK